jgi:hypothetical protein
LLDLYEELTSIIGALDARGIEYALCGGLAMAVWDEPRATVDIDLLVQPQSVPAIEEVVAPLGYTFKARPMSFSDGAIEIRRVTKIDPESHDPLMLDLLLVTDGVLDVWLSRERVVLDHAEITVVSREGLIKLKSFRGSGRDADDIARLRRKRED